MFEQPIPQWFAALGGISGWEWWVAGTECKTVFLLEKAETLP